MLKTMGPCHLGSFRGRMDQGRLVGLLVHHLQGTCVAAVQLEDSCDSHDPKCMNCLRRIAFATTRGALVAYLTEGANVGATGRFWATLFFQTCATSTHVYGLSQQDTSTTCGSTFGTTSHACGHHGCTSWKPNGQQRDDSGFARQFRVAAPASPTTRGTGSIRSVIFSSCVSDPFMLSESNLGSCLDLRAFSRCSLPITEQ